MPFAKLLAIIFTYNDGRSVGTDAINVLDWKGHEKVFMLILIFAFNGIAIIDSISLIKSAGLRYKVVYLVGS